LLFFISFSSPHYAIEAEASGRRALEFLGAAFHPITGSPRAQFIFEDSESSPLFRKAFSRHHQIISIELAYFVGNSELRQFVWSKAECVFWIC
jgi:hypothetical protein